MISLQSLITIAPLTPEVQKELLEALPTLSEEKKLALTDLCWSSIQQQFAQKVQYAIEDELVKVGMGEKHYSEEELQHIEDNVFAEFAQKMRSLDEEGSIDEMRKELKKIKYFKNIKK